MEATVEYPLGHARRRAEGILRLEDKFRAHLTATFPTVQQRRILDASLDPVVLEAMPVHEYVALYVAG
jgi:2-methylcitrate dehydratase